LHGAVELAELNMGLLVFLGWAYTQQQKRHIAIDILYLRFPGWLQRTLNLFNLVLGIVFMVIVAWQAYDFSVYSKVSTETTENLGLPVWPFKLSVLIGASSFCLQLIFELVDEIQNLRER
jgi:TRAP-type C4-dicarboxylate transport system permease small subunit